MPQESDSDIERSVRTEANAQKKAVRLQERLDALNEHEEAERAVDKNTVRLRALRLAKEAEDRARKPAK
jgi:hypothetical protein